MCYTDHAHNNLERVTVYMAARKESYVVSELKEHSNSKSVTVHGKLIELSPIRSSIHTSKKYFTGKITDGQETKRVVAFDPKLHAKMEKFKEEGSIIALVDCSIQQSKYSDGVEIIASQKTKLELSPKKIKISDEMMKKQEGVVIRLEKCDVGERVNVVGKIVTVQEPTVVSSKGQHKILKKQDCLIADSTAVAKIVLWEQNISLFEQGSSYKLTKSIVSLFNDTKYLTIPEDAIVEKVSDVGAIAPVESSYEEDLHEVIEGKVDVVLAVNEHTFCVSCKGEVQPYSETFGKCTECQAKMKLSACSTNVEVRFIMKTKDGTMKTLVAYNEQVFSIIDGLDGDDIADKMLMAPMLKCISSSNIITQVTAYTPSQ